LLAHLIDLMIETIIPINFLYKDKSKNRYYVTHSTNI